MTKYRTVLFAVIFCVALCGKGWSQEELKPLVDRIVSLTNENDISIVSIGGCPGVGKSSLANILQKGLSQEGITSVIISLDHYGLSQQDRKQFTKELDPRRIQWYKLHDNLTSIRNGDAAITKPTINQLTKEMGEETIDLTGVKCIIFEGCYSLGDDAPMDFLQYSDLAIYLESSLENIYDWKWQRELKKSSPRTAEAFYFHMADIVQDFAFHVYPTKKNADIVISSDFFHRYTISNTINNRPEPDFTPLRLEILTY